MINKTAYSQNKKSVTIINVARGSNIVEKDLLDALDSGQVGFVALDVFDEEPPLKENLLVLSQKTICIPHPGASTKEAQDKVNNIYLETDLRVHMLFVYNYDKQGVIASLANVFYIRGINIGGMHFDRENVDGPAIYLLDLDKDLEENVIREIQSLSNILAIKKIELSKRRVVHKGRLWH